MNILQITSDYIPHPLWGMGWHVNQLVEGISKYSEDTVYIATSYKSVNIHKNVITTARETDDLLLSHNKYEIFNDFNKFNVWQEKLADEINSKNLSIDIIHCHNWMSWLTAKKVKEKFPQAKVFITFHFLQKQYETMKDNPIPS